MEKGLLKAHIGTDGERDPLTGLAEVHQMEVRAGRGIEGRCLLGRDTDQGSLAAERIGEDLCARAGIVKAQLARSDGNEQLPMCWLEGGCGDSRTFKYLPQGPSIPDGCYVESHRVGPLRIGRCQISPSIPVKAPWPEDRPERGWGK